MSKILAFACVHLVILNTAYAQCLNRILPALQQNLLPLAETIMPNQVLVNQVPNYMPAASFDYGYDTIYPTANPMMPTTTIIQDSTVANNLANALQLLVVSNLLSNTLPSAGEVIVPSYGPIEYSNGMLSPVGAVSPCSNFSPYNYVY